MTPKLVPLAEVARPHGVQGELRLKVYNTDSDLLLDKTEVFVELGKGPAVLRKVRRTRRAHEAILMILEGCDGRDAAEAMRGAKICLARDAFPPLADGEFYACDVVGLKVISPEGEIGTVLELYPYPTCDALIVATPRGKIEVPVVEDVVESIDVGEGVVRVVSRAALELA